MQEHLAMARRQIYPSWLCTWGTGTSFNTSRGYRNTCKQQLNAMHPSDGQAAHRARRPHCQHCMCKHVWFRRASRAVHASQAAQHGHRCPAPSIPPCAHSLLHLPWGVALRFGPWHVRLKEGPTQQGAKLTTALDQSMRSSILSSQALLAAASLW